MSRKKRNGHSDGSEDDEDQSGLMDITKSDLLSEIVMKNVYANLKSDYYWSNDWSIEMYTLQACRGFIAVAHIYGSQELLLPQIQKSYCVLQFKNLLANNKRIIKKLRKSKRRLHLRVNHSFDCVVDSIHTSHESKSWLSPMYRHLAKQLFRKGRMEIDVGPDGKIVTFQMCSIELYCDEDLVAGEIGYSTGSVFTSLTGFIKRLEEYENLSIGLIQVLSLGRLLERTNFSFLNLGQPPQGSHMLYKAQIGGKEISRDAFLLEWNLGLHAEYPDTSFFNFECQDVLSTLLS